MSKPRAPKKRRCTYKNTTYVATPLGTELLRVVVTRGKQRWEVEMAHDAFEIIEASCNGKRVKRRKTITS